MYTKEELLENKKMDEIIKKNKVKVTKVVKKRKLNKALDYILYFVACGTFLFGLMFLIAVIERMSF